MGVRSPYLSGTDRTDGAEEQTAVTVRSDIETDVAELTVHGRWDGALSEATSLALHGCFAGHPGALLVNLATFEDAAAESAPAWATTLRHAAAMHPPVQVAMCVPPDLLLADRLQRICAGHFLPVYATARQARVALAGRLPAERMRRDLPPDPDAPSVARDLVGDACEAWGLTALLYPARLVVSELVTNAVEHAGTDITVVMARRGGGLHLAVGDRKPVLPRLLTPAPPLPGRPLDERGRGLQTVHATAAAWGATRSADGKVVWAMLRDDAEATSRHPAFG